VILGHLIPAGTAFKPHLEMKVKRLAKAPLPKEFRPKDEQTEAGFIGAPLQEGLKQAQEKTDDAVKEALGLD